MVQYSRADIAAVILAIALVSIVSAVAIDPLPSSPTLLDGMGRITLIYGVAAIVLFLVASRESRTFWKIVLGSIGVTFFGSFIGLAIYSLLGWLSP